MSTCTRPGKHGLQHLFAIPYGDRGYGERDHVIGRWRTWAYDADDALERFYDRIGQGSDLLERPLADFGWFPGQLVLAAGSNSRSMIIELVGEATSSVEEFFERA